MKIALCQIRTELNYEDTMAKAEKYVCKATDSGADVIVLPEMFCCPYQRDYFEMFRLKGHEDAIHRMSEWAKMNQIILIGGSVPEVTDHSLYNTCFVYNETGDCIAKHRKIHLFDVDIPGMCFHESDSFSSGNQITVFDTKFGKFGVAICFDLRFNKLFRSMALMGADIVFLPAQFNNITGPAHWDTLIKARALDNQIFVAACAAARYEGFTYECWGHSEIAEPYGSILASSDQTEQILYSDIDLSLVKTTRERLPVMSALRTDVYSLPLFESERE